MCALKYTSLGVGMGLESFFVFLSASVAAGEDGILVEEVRREFKSGVCGGIGRSFEVFRRNLGKLNGFTTGEIAH